ncbi:MAG: ABC transporter permease [Anaerolineales bacterium]|nr:ABC transporter permease [Anaerolineales bacterium]
MGLYIVKRLLEIPITVLIISIFVFGLMHLVPGDPIVEVLGPFAAEDSITAYRTEFGLDQPLLIQYVDWIERLFHGDLGKSIFTREPVSKMIADRLLVTLTVSAAGAIIYLTVAFPAGILAALNKNRLIDYLIRTLATLGMSVPGFFLALVLIVIFGVQLRWVPFAGFVSPFDDFVGGIKCLIIPAFSLGIMSTGYTIRMLRACMLDVLGDDYVRTARSKGLAEKWVIVRHALPNAMLPVITVLVLNAAFMIAGTVIIEMIFAMPGMGRLMVNAVMKRDFPIIQGVTLMMGLVFVFASLVADILYAIVDPRIRLSHSIDR